MFAFQYFAEIAQNPETNQRTGSQDLIGSGPWTSVRDPPSSLRHVQCYQPVCAAQPQPSQVFQHQHQRYEMQLYKFKALG